MAGTQENVPSCDWHWSEVLHGRGVLLDEDKNIVTFHPQKSSGCVAIMGTKRFLPNMEHYFEVKMIGPFFGKARMVGIGTKHTALQSNQYDFYPLIGKDTCSWGLNYTGETYHQSEIQQHVHLNPDQYRSIQIGVLYDSYYGTLSFDVNGKSCGIAFKNVVTSMELYAMACASAAKSVMHLMHTHSSVMSLKALCRGVVRMAVREEEDFSRLPLPEHLRAYLAFRTHEPPSISLLTPSTPSQLENKNHVSTEV